MSHSLLSAGGQLAAFHARHAGGFPRNMPHLQRSVAVKQPGNCTGIFSSDMASICFIRSVAAPPGVIGILIEL